jgi:uncharacterized OB-fold protein
LTPSTPAGGPAGSSAPAPTSRSEALSSDRPPRREEPPDPSLLTLLDFYPPQDPRWTRIAPFFAALREGRLTTTRCPRDGSVQWPPAVACPRCHGEELQWTDLPREGRLYAFSEVRGGAPLGMEGGVPFVVGLVELSGASLRLFSRIVGKPYAALSLGEEVRFETFPVRDGRVFYRFRAGRPPVATP